MSKTVGSLLSEAAFFADGANRFGIAVATRLDEVWAVEDIVGAAPVVDDHHRVDHVLPVHQQHAAVDADADDEDDASAPAVAPVGASAVADDDASAPAVAPVGASAVADDDASAPAVAPVGASAVADDDDRLGASVTGDDRDTDISLGADDSHGAAFPDHLHQHGPLGIVVHRLRLGGEMVGIETELTSASPKQCPGSLWLIDDVGDACTVRPFVSAAARAFEGKSNKSADTTFNALSAIYGRFR